MGNTSVIHVVATECPSETEDTFSKWYDEQHIPDLLKFKRLKKVTRYRNLHPDGENPKFLTIYEFDRREDLEDYLVSPERTSVHEDAMSTNRELNVSLKWRVQYEVLRSWQQ